MTEDRYEYFIAGPSASAVLDECAESRHAYKAAVITIVTDVLGRPGGAYYRRQAFAGFKLEGGEPIPPGLKHYSHDPADMYRPDRTPAGKAIGKRIAALPRVPAHPTERLIDKKHLSMFGGIEVGRENGSIQTRSVGAERLGGEWIICVPVPYGEKCAPVPLDSAPLLCSEYWRRREAADTTTEVRP